VYKLKSQYKTISNLVNSVKGCCDPPPPLRKLPTLFVHPYQLSIDSGCLSRNWITTNIVPEYTRRVINIYHLISPTSIVVKVMERIIHHQLSAALESNNLISEAQHGFRNKHSTITLILSSVNDWASAL